MAVAIPKSTINSVLFSINLRSVRLSRGRELKKYIIERSAATSAARQTPDGKASYDLQAAAQATSHTSIVEYFCIYLFIYLERFLFFSVEMLVFISVFWFILVQFEAHSMQTTRNRMRNLTRSDMFMWFLMKNA